MKSARTGLLHVFFLLGLGACGPEVAALTPEPLRPADAFADFLVSFRPGPSAGFGRELLPDVVLGPPRGEGNGQGSLHVVSFGQAGEMVLEFTDIELIDGEGIDLLVFENPFPGWIETGEVSVSDDGKTWSTFPCDAQASDSNFPGCAGVQPVYASPDNDISSTDVAHAGGDGFDLAKVGLSHARFVRIRDSGQNKYGGTTGGFDLDAVAVVNGEPRRLRHP